MVGTTPTSRLDRCQVEYGSLREAERAVSELDDRWPDLCISEKTFHYPWYISWLVSVPGFMKTEESDEFTMLPEYLQKQSDWGEAFS